MARLSDREKAAVMIASAEGAKIEMALAGEGHFVYTTNPRWNWEECDYRVVVEPVTFFGNKWKDDSNVFTHATHEDAVAATQMNDNAYEFIGKEFIEVIKD